MNSTRARCGCRLAREADLSPPGDKRDALLEDSEECRARWGCPGGPQRGRPLPPDLAEEARHVARVTGTPEASTCPLACVTFADPWVVEITRAVSLAAEWHVPVADTLGRVPCSADLAAMHALKAAQGDAWESTRKIEDEKQRAKTGSPR